MGCVYLLPHRNEGRFKIGKSTSLASRILELGGPKEIDIDKAVAIYTPKYSGLERALHTFFSEHRLALAESFDGHTEWFDIGIWQDVIDFVEEQRARLGINKIEDSLSYLFKKESGVSFSSQKKTKSSRTKFDVGKEIADWESMVDKYINTLSEYLERKAIIGYLSLDECDDRDISNCDGYLFVRPIYLAGSDANYQSQQMSAVQIMNRIYTAGSFCSEQEFLCSRVHGSGCSYRQNEDEIGYLITDVKEDRLFNGRAQELKRIYERIEQFYIDNIPGYSRVCLDLASRLEISATLELMSENCNAYDIKKYNSMRIGLMKANAPVSNAFSASPIPL